MAMTGFVARKLFANPFFIIITAIACRISQKQIKFKSNNVSECDICVL